MRREKNSQRTDALSALSLLMLLFLLFCILHRMISPQEGKYELKAWMNHHVAFP